MSYFEKPKQTVKSKKILVGYSSQGGLSRLSSLFLKEQSNEIRCVHFILGPLTSKALGIPKYDLKLLSKDVHIVDMSKESDAFVEAMALMHFGQMRSFPLKAYFDSQFLIPALWAEASKHSCSGIATGHRARVSLSGENSPVLAKCKDPTIDQSDVLCLAQKAYLKNLITPLGHLKLQELQKLCEKYEVLNYINICSERERLMSQRELLQILDTKSLSRVKTKGYVIDEKNNVLGEHAGLLGFKMGSGEGLSQFSNIKSDSVVLAMDLIKQWLVVGPAEKLQKRSILCQPVNWVADDPNFFSNDACSVCLGATDHEVHGAKTRLLIDSMLRVDLEPGAEEEFQVEAGSLILLYRGEQCLGASQVLESYR